MAFADYDKYDGVGLGELVRAKKVKAREVMEEAIRRAEAVNPTLNFLTYKAYDVALQAADDPALPDGPLKGVPWLIKDLATAWPGHPTTNCCPYFKQLRPNFESEVLRRIRAAGMIPFGKTTSPEIGWAVSTESRMFGITRSPWNPERTPGGSSGGSAAAVAARVLPMAEGSDGGGSIRVPAANCNLLGLKPARGRISLAPASADFWYGGATFLCMSQSVRDTAALLDATHGQLPGDPYQIRLPARPYAAEVGADPGRLRIALVTDTPDHGTPLDPEIKASVLEAARLLEGLGHRLEPQKVPYEYWPLYKIYTSITAVQTATWFDGAPAYVGHASRWEEMAPLYWTMIYKGRSFSAADHSNHVEIMRQTCRTMLATMAAFDLWLMPTVPMLPRTHGYYDMSLHVDQYDDERMGPDCCYTSPFNAAGLPAVSVPMGFSRDGLPIGVQFVARDCDEAALIRIASQIEKARPWNGRRPPICS
jgi:amidase